MPLRLVFDGGAVVDDDIADRLPFVEKVITDVRGYLDPRIMEVLSAPVRNNTGAIDHRFQDIHPGVARVLLFRETSAPNECTAKFTFDSADGGAFLRLLVGKTKTVRMPIGTRNDTAVVFVFPLDGERVARKPLIFLGSVGGNVRSVGEVFAAYNEYLAAMVADDDYVPPNPSELAALKRVARAGLAHQTGAFVPKEEHGAALARLRQLEESLDVLRRAFSFVNRLFEE